MKKNKHPKNFKTSIIMSDGSHLQLNWIFSKKKIKLESDYLNHYLWQQNKKFFK